MTNLAKLVELCGGTEKEVEYAKKEVKKIAMKHTGELVTLLYDESYKRELNIEYDSREFMDTNNICPECDSDGSLDGVYFICLYGNDDVVLDEDFPCDITKAQMYRIADTWEKLEKM